MVQPAADLTGVRPNGAPVRRIRRAGALPYLLAAPSLVVMAFLLGIPLLKLIQTSFQRFTRREFFNPDEIVSVGLENYKAILTDDSFLTVVWRTLIVTAIMVALTMLLGTLIALLLERLGMVWRTLVGLAMLVAWATPAVSATQVWKWMLNSQSGILTWLLEQIGVDLRGNNAVLFDAHKVLAVIIVIIVWQAVPFVALTLFAGLTQVPRELYEAAKIDGASAWKTFWNVTFPMMRPIFVLLTTLSIIWDFRVFTQVWTFNRGGPEQGSLLLGAYSYFAAFDQKNFGQGAAVAVIMVLITLAVTAYYVRQLVRSGETS